MYSLNFLGMEIKINDVLTKVPEKSTLQNLVFLHTKEKTQGIAVAINEQVIPQPQWPSVLIQPTDQILIIKAKQGG